MKAHTFLFVVLVVLCSCSTTKLTPEQKAEKSAEYAQMVTNAIDNHSFKIDIQYMQPTRGSIKRLDYGYSIKVSGDSLYSHLPYFGRAYNVPYGGGKGLSFQEPAYAIDVVHKKKGIANVRIQVRNNEDNYLYSLDIFNNGKATLNVFSRERESISFSGEMTFDK